jgi:energy-coupling factor transporter ATP-binding protein EcfA2
MRDGTIDPGTAALLWAALARRRSLAVVAGPSGTGKSTLLRALLAFLPHDTRHVFLRGCFETFAFLADPAIVPRQTALLINEISPHLPVYLWGPAVERVVAASERGFCVLTTAHAASVDQFIGGLAGSPLRLPAPRLAAFEFVAIMERTNAVPSGRRVREVCRLLSGRQGIGIERLAAGPLQDISQQATNSLAQPRSDWFPSTEILERTELLERLRDRATDRLTSDALAKREFP